MICCCLNEKQVRGIKHINDATFNFILFIKNNQIIFLHYHFFKILKQIVKLKFIKNETVSFYIKYNVCINNIKVAPVLRAPSFFCPP